jgi:hypothetical protein
LSLSCVYVYYEGKRRKKAERRERRESEMSGTS